MTSSLKAVCSGGVVGSFRSGKPAVLASALLRYVLRHLEFRSRSVFDTKNRVVSRKKHFPTRGVLNFSSKRRVEGGTADLGGGLPSNEARMPVSHLHPADELSSVVFSPVNRA